MLEYEFSLTHVFPHWNRVFGFNPYMRKYHCVKNVPIWSFLAIIFPHSDQKNPACEHFSRSVWVRGNQYILRSVLFVTLSWRRSLSYRNQAIDLLCKSIINGLQSMYWFLYERDLRHERVNLGIDLIRFLI